MGYVLPFSVPKVQLMIYPVVISTIGLLFLGKLVEVLKFPTFSNLRINCRRLYARAANCLKDDSLVSDHSLSSGGPVLLHVCPRVQPILLLKLLFSRAIIRRR
ncbi:hypothetical protein RHMOL_Rhmol09G0212800 [Rhododendron molle]|uniref:Uncharacterized protein n=1 Tax=Rhododendron molle TaxID=49168 RepID=A0ACC0MGC9_RHOML|nr:hypothetical protein RHMOL_Rhmol09G0212800 [Rhododendron molle]